MSGEGEGGGGGVCDGGACWEEGLGGGFVEDCGVEGGVEGGAGGYAGADAGGCYCDGRGRWWWWWWW